LEENNFFTMENKSRAILIVEDDEMVANMYKIKLENNCWKVILAQNGQDGLESASREKPDLILLDIILPQVDGFAVLQSLKEKNDLREIPVVILTNLGTDEDVAKGRELGAAGYIIKSEHTPSQICEEIKKYIKS